jgi:outer membrane protein, multidrug efflux system
MKRLTIKAARDRRRRMVRAATRPTLWFAVGVVGINFCGCTLHKPPAHATIVNQALPKATPLPPAWNASPDAANVSDDWVKSLHDSGLEVVVREAIANNLDLRQAAAQVDEARQNVIVVGSKLKPQIGATFGVDTTRSSNATSSNQAESNSLYAGVSWEIDVWGRLRSQHAAAQESYEAIALDYVFARQSLAATTAKSWYLAIETRQLLALTEESVTIYTKLLELVKVRRAAGKVADLDVAEASYELNEAQSQLASAQGLYSEARRTLEVLVGRYPAAELEVAEAFAPLPPPVAAGVPSSLLERRPDIVAAEHQVVAAFRSQQAAKLALLPTFSFDLEGGRLSDQLLSVLSLNPWLIHSAVGMFVPIYQGGALQAQVKIATAQEEQSIAYFGSVALNALEEAEVGLTNERLFAQRLSPTESAVSDHTEAVRVANLRYKSGNMDFLSVLQLQEGQIQSEGALIQLRNAQLANRINLHLALGGSFDSSPATASSATTTGKPERLRQNTSCSR